MSFLNKIKPSLSLSLALFFPVNAAFADSASEVSARLANLAAQQASAIADDIHMSGILEVESFYTDSDEFSGETVYNTVLATAELAIEATLTDTIKADFVLLYEGGEGDETGINVDVASLVFEGVFGANFLLGRYYLPFGAYETKMVNDTLLHELVEIRKTIAMLSRTYEGYSAFIYAFNSDVADQTVSYGLSLDAQYEYYSIGLDYISNVAEVGGVYEMLEDAGYTGHIAGKDQNSAGLVVRGQASIAGFQLIAERFESEELKALTFGIDSHIKPKAWHLELSTDYHDWAFAAAFQRTDGLVGVLAKERISVSAGTSLTDDLSLIAELWRDQDYSIKQGGTAKSSHSGSVQLAFKF